MAENIRAKAILTPTKAIRAKCLDCCCGQANEVKLCPIPDCSLYPYRLGHNPSRAGLGNRSPNFARKSLAEMENN
jgi:hypothetical protein